MSQTATIQRVPIKAGTSMAPGTPSRSLLLKRCWDCGASVGAKERVCWRCGNKQPSPR